MKKTVIILLLGIGAVALISLCIAQRREIQKLSAKREVPAPVVEPAIPVAHKGAEAGGPVTRAKQKPPVATVQENDDEAVPPAKPHVAAIEVASITNKSAAAPTNESPMAGIAAMMKAPGMKDMIRAQQKGQMDLTYGSLFKYLQLSDGDLEKFKGVLLDKQMALMDVSLDMMNSATTPEERKAATDRIKEMTNAYDSKIKEFLGDENYAVYQSYEVTQPERMQVNLFKGSLDAGGQMTVEQEDNLIQAMHDVRTNFHYSVTGLEDKQAPDFSQFTPDRITKMLADSAKLQEQYIARAAAILTPAQLEQFKANQKQQQAMQEMGMKMAAKMFGPPAK